MALKLIEAFNPVTGKRESIKTKGGPDYVGFVNSHQRADGWILLAEYVPGVDRSPISEWDGDAPIFQRVKALEEAVTELRVQKAGA